MATTEPILPPAIESTIEEHESTRVEQIALLAGVSRDGAASCMAAARVAKRWGAGHRLTEAAYVTGVLDAARISAR